MPWIKFNAPYDFKPKPQVTIAYKPGLYLVTTKCAALAIAAGKAERASRKKVAVAVTEEKHEEQA